MGELSKVAMIEDSKTKGTLYTENNLSELNSIYSTTRNEAKNISNLKAASIQRKNMQHQFTR